MSELLGQLLALGYWVSIIALCLNDRFKLAITLIIISLTSYPAVLGIICQYSLSRDYPIDPSNLYLFYGISLVLTIFTTIAIIMPQNNKGRDYPDKPPCKRWFFFTGGLSLYGLTLFTTLMCWYSPSSLGMAEPMPMAGVIVQNIGLMLSALLFYISTQWNSSKRPNLMAKLVVLLIFLILHYMPLVLSLILLYAFPSEPKNIFPLEAGINMITSLTWAMLLILILRKCVKKIPTLDLKKETAGAENQ